MYACVCVIKLNYQSEHNCNSKLILFTLCSISSIYKPKKNSHHLKIIIIYLTLPHSDSNPIANFISYY